MRNEGEESGKEIVWRKIHLVSIDSSAWSKRNNNALCREEKLAMIKWATYFSHSIFHFQDILCAGMIRTFSITANVELRKAALIFGLNAQRLTVIVKRQAVYIAMMTNSKCKWSKCQSLDTLHTDDSHKQFSFWLFHHYSTLLREITFQYFVQQFGHFVLTLLSTIS